jgi:hypothetical protein
MLHKIRVAAMAKMFVCKNCQQLKPANIRLKANQGYCDENKCQRARKAAWQKEKMANDPNYRAKQIECLNEWRKKRPLDKYQKLYRQQHPEYVKRNRELQRIRNSKRDKQLACKKIVKMDALKEPSEKSNAYIMNPYRMDDSGKIVKMDALIVQLTDLQTNIQQILPASS